MSQIPTFCSTLKPKQNKIFSYKGQEYPVDFNIIKLNCLYFSDHSLDFEHIEKIELIEAIDIPSETIQAFLSCSQCQPTPIYDIFGINYLSTKYQNEELKNFSQNFIEENYNQLLFQSLSFKDQIRQKSDNQSNEMSIDTSNEERILSTNLIEFLEDERIFSLQIDVLYRVLKKFLIENKEILNDVKTRKRFNNFFLKCLKEYKKSASILFLNVNLDKNLIVSLHDEFKDVFDYNMLNTKSLFDEAYNLIGENDQIKVELNIVKGEKNDLNTKNNRLKNGNTELQAKISKLDVENNRLKNENTELQAKISKLDTENNHMKNENTELQTKISKLDTENNRLKNENTELQTKIVITIPHSTGQEFNGLINYLKKKSGENIDDYIEITASSVNGDNYYPQNVIMFDTKNCFFSKDKPNSWISFHFKKHQIILKSYTLQRKPSLSCPLNWVIEGSNDNENWENLNEQIRCNLLDDIKPFTFSIDKNDNKCFKFIRMKINGENSNGFYNLIIMNIEFYGILIPI